MDFWHRLYSMARPVLDIKPYVPLCRIVCQWRIMPLPIIAPTLITVNWQPSALQQAEQHAQRLQQPLSALIEQCFSPRYHVRLINSQRPERIYGVQFYDVTGAWHYLTLEQIEVIEVCLV